MAGKYRVSFQGTGTSETPSGLTVRKVQFRVSWNGVELGRGECTRTALEKSAIDAIMKVWKSRRSEFTPNLPSPANGLLQLAEEPYERMDSAEAAVRAKYNKPDKDGELGDGLKRM